MRSIIAAALLAITATPAVACSFNTDCEVGSQCLKRPGQLEGICAGGLFPGKPVERENSYDRMQQQAEQYRRQQQRRQSTNPYDLNGTEGNRCSFNTDCGPGSSCLKSGLYGVCVVR